MHPLMNKTKVIMINDNILFFPVRRELKNSLTGDSFILHTPANCCFLHLLANRQKILSRSELIKHSWNNCAQIISDNTFNQMVFNLRQNLAKVGGDAIIVTVPRRGLKINPEVSVKFIDDSSQERPHASNVFSNFISIIIGALSSCCGNNILLVLSLVGLFFLSAFLYAPVADNYAFHDYHHQEYEKCTVSYNEKIGKDNVISMIIKSRIDCSRKRHIILTQSDNHSRLSLISCPAGTLIKKNCTLSLNVQ